MLMLMFPGLTQHGSDALLLERHDWSPEALLPVFVFVFPSQVCGA